MLVIKVTHNWILDEISGQWLISCQEFKRTFSPKTNYFNMFGTCPYCKKNAKLELDNRKEMKRLESIEKQQGDKVRVLNTLSGYF